MVITNVCSSEAFFQFQLFIFCEFIFVESTFFLKLRIFKFVLLIILHIESFIHAFSSDSLAFFKKTDLKQFHDHANSLLQMCLLPEGSFVLAGDDATVLQNLYWHADHTCHDGSTALDKRDDSDLKLKGILFQLEFIFSIIYVINLYCLCVWSIVCLFLLMFAVLIR
jgi:hypothetical protein